MKHEIIFAVVVLSLTLYLFLSRQTRRNKWDKPDDFFLARGYASSSQYAASQTAYTLQMATVFPFFVFAFTGNAWIALWNTIFWLVGIGLYFIFIVKFAAGPHRLAGRSNTVHAAIAQFNDIPNLRYVTAIMTCIAFAGLALFEITWGAQLFRILLGNSSPVYYFAIAALAAYIGCYIWIGGQRAAILTGQVQLLIAYVGLHATLAWLIWHDGVQIEKLQFPVIVPIVIIFSLVMAVIRFNHFWSDKKAPRYMHALNALTLSSLVALIVSLGMKPYAFNASIPPETWIKLFENKTAWVTALSVSLLPLGFQFVDMTNWQRIVSLEGSPKDLIKSTRRGLFQYLIESPLSWLLPILLGSISIQIFAVGPTDSSPWESFLRLVINAPGPAGWLLGMAICLAVVAIFVSTADELISAIGYTATYDLSPVGRRLRGSPPEVDAKTTEEAIRIGRRAMFVTSMIVALAYILVDILFDKGDTLIGAFLACYAPLVALAPSLIVPVFSKRKVGRGAIYLSLVGGATLGIAAGVLPLFAPAALELGEVWIWMPPIVSFGWAWVIYLVGWVIGDDRENKASA